jgi:endo-1,4-beta-xylanase
LKALVAPRPLLTTEALGDLWANPTGTWRTYKAAAEVYRFLGVEDRIGIWYRPGEHEHGRDDWHAFLDFADWHFKGILPDRCYDDNPFPSRQEYP